MEVNAVSNSNTEQSYQEIINRLHALRRQWRVLLFSHSLLRWLGALALALTPALIIDQILPLPRFLRMGLVLVWLGVGVYAAFRYLIRPVFQKLTNARVAAYVEDYYPGFEKPYFECCATQARNGEQPLWIRFGIY